MERFLRGNIDQAIGKLLKDLAVPIFIGLGEVVPGNAFPKPEVVGLRVMGLIKEEFFKSFYLCILVAIFCVLLPKNGADSISDYMFLTLNFFIGFLKPNTLNLKISNKLSWLSKYRV